MAKTGAEVHQQLFQKEIDATNTLIDSVDPEKRMRQLKEGRSHPLWLIGHLANTNNLLVNMWCLEGESLMPKELIKKFSPDFSGGDAPTSDASYYPSWDEVVGLYKSVASACVEGIGKLSDDELWGPLRGGAPGAMQAMFGPVDDTIRGMATHNAYHRGQIGIINAQD
jgi:hypothetical protein